MKDQCSSLDRISSLPSPIIETILCWLPLQEAGRTSILSRSWRYHWTRIPKLTIGHEFRAPASKNQLPVLEQTSDNPEQGTWMIKRCNLLNAIRQVLLLHNGPIHEFWLSSSDYDSDDEIEAYDEIDQMVIRFLKHNVVKKLHLGFPCELPVYFFLLHQLTDLDLDSCGIYHMPTFNGFGSLTSLTLHNVKISKKTLMCIFSNNPLLKSLGLFIIRDDNIIIDDHSTITELFNCLPLLEQLHIGQIEYFAGGAVPLVLPTSLIHLKYLYIDRMFSIDDYELSFLLLMLRSSPNLEKIYLEVAADVSIDEIQYEGTAPWQHHWDIWLDHLVELGIENFSTSLPEMKLLKLILAKSPVLKKVTISLYHSITVDKEVEMLKTLLRFPRAAPFVDIVVDSG